MVLNIEHDRNCDQKLWHKHGTFINLYVNLKNEEQGWKLAQKQKYK